MEIARENMSMKILMDGYSVYKRYTKKYDDTFLAGGEYPQLTC
jgi:hypothetical protein